MRGVKNAKMENHKKIYSHGFSIAKLLNPQVTIKINCNLIYLFIVYKQNIL